jgi:TetR/AcrR family transcriptional regulator, transcriptional repressor of bet genes
MTRTNPKYRREQPEVRRESLVDATLKCLREHGRDGVSVRRIAAAAGVSVGLINHHYTTIDELIAHAYERLATDLLKRLLSAIETAGPTPRARLSAFFVASFSPEVLDPDLLGIWVVFWSMVRHSPVMQTVQHNTWGDYREALVGLLTDLVAEEKLPSVNIKLAAMGLSALLDGCWLEGCLDPSFEPQSGIALCEAWLDALTNGKLPKAG